MSDKKSTSTGVLYVVATPIGNLEDLSARALGVLGRVDRLLVEDSRQTRKLLQRHGVSRPMTALHEHNERALVPSVVARLVAGESLALVSDAGTPLISDPGFVLVGAARAAGVPVVPVPGPCAAISALSAAGLPAQAFAFEGYPPARKSARRRVFARLARERRTLIFYEAPHRIMDCLADVVQVFGEGRRIAVARELTKIHETIRLARAAEMLAWMAADPDRQKGEFVLLVEGLDAGGDTDRGADEDPALAVARRALVVLSRELPLKSAVRYVEEITGVRRNRLYRIALENRK